MTDAWWGREATAPDAARVISGGIPQLLDPDPETVYRAMQKRIVGFTPEWTNQQPDDAGQALALLFGLEVAPVLSRVNRLPEKLLREYLDAGGVRPLAASPAGALLKFTISDTADGVVAIPQGSQATAPPAEGQGGRVTFETVTDLEATAARIVELQVFQGGLFQMAPVPPPATGFLPFGARARAGDALWVGLSAENDLGSSLSLAALVTGPAGAPPPVTRGGVVPLPVDAAPLVRWDVLDGDTAQPAQLTLDETGGLVRAGMIQLTVPRQWRPARPAALGDGPERRWLRARIVHGSFVVPPLLADLFLNAARAVAQHTVYDEALEPLNPESTGGQMVRLSQTPVLAGSLVLEVDEGAAGDVFAAAGLSAAGEESTVRRWEEVDDLLAYGEDDRVYVLDPSTGVVTFGDGQHGRLLPRGFRNVVAARYSVGGGAAGAVEADRITTLVTSIGFVSAVTNPVAASGGTDPEPLESALRRGPGEIRARGRAVATADYEVLALHAPEANIARAHAVAGLHPAHPGRPTAGIVGVFVLPRERDDGPPTPDEDSLAAVASYLADQAAPAGVEVITAAPVYHRVRVETQVLIDAGADPGGAARDVAAAIDEYLDPLSGGDSGTGWPFGGPLRYVPLLQRVLSGVAVVRAIVRLDTVVDGVRIPQCSDYTLSANSLIWPDSHEIVADREAPS